MKKGKVLKKTNDLWERLYKGVVRSFYKRHESNEANIEARFYIDAYMRERRIYEKYLTHLPKRFTKKYNEYAYKVDKTNVLDHYTPWVREDHWHSKKSLRRIRQYEKREGLRPFEDILEETKKQQWIKKAEIREDQYAQRALRN